VEESLIIIKKIPHATSTCPAIIKDDLVTLSLTIPAIGVVMRYLKRRFDSKQQAGDATKL